MTDENTKDVALEDATFDQLKAHAENVMGITVHPAASKPEKLIAQMKAADDELETITVSQSETPPPKPKAEAKKDAGSWEPVLDGDGNSLGVETHSVTGESRKTASFDINDTEIDPEELMWVSLSEEEGVKTQRHMPISLNGNVILVPRGIRCPLKRKFINVLNDAVKTTYSHDEETGETHASEAPTVPFSVFGTVSDLGDNYGGEKGEKLLAIVRGQAKR